MDVSPILARTEAVTRRIRLARALRTGATMFAPGVAGIAVGVAAVELGAIGAADLRFLVALGLGVPALVTAAAVGRGLPTLLAAEILDRAHALQGRLTTALELRNSDAPLAHLAVEDALARVGNASAARAFPIRVPMHGRALVIACATLLVASTLQRPPPPPAREAPPAHLAPLLVHADDLTLEHDALERLVTGTDPTPQLRAAIDDTNALLEALEDRSLDRTEALRQIGALTDRLERPRPISLTQREDMLRAMGDRMGHGEASADLAQALRDADARRVQEALEALAERMRAGDMSPAERRRLEDALAEAREADLLDDTIEPESTPSQDGTTQTPEEQERLLEQQRETVEQLRQEQQARAEAREELERLERELDEATERMSDPDDVENDQGDPTEDAAEDLNRMARDQQSEQQMQQLAQQLRQLREMIRRQRAQGGNGEDGEGGDGEGQGSQGRSGRMDRYVLRAGGGDGGEGGGMRIGMRGGGGSDGEGQTEGSQGEGGQDEQGTPGGTSGSGDGTNGEGGAQGEDGEPEQMLVLGDEGGSDAILELPGFGRSGTGPARGGGDGEGDEGSGAGHDHDPTSLADPSDRNGDHRTVTVHGDDQGRGPSRSEVIRGGAARGFASRDYERVYADYEAHAERAIEQDEIPPGYRFYVRRYFDLIRPRD